ncbi:uncharacterized protein CC84DRAFT_1206622 [Paraphaeosphaeria sporulosa]|uniref:EF-hand domain-containing protein n=1 Tax=Paraphaeosphaeria sporulosa TaxID=1460663 RepID=A0A177CEE3_9PLEO|nr:uncharacterized protein CC84DRAFT_1206622 [Paraphaeosphaeria sporulosa]OAG05137.1 hypothetical protein CC84DRAFT_1206622 [Paraphaeosphaeria sporulosa]
MRFIAVAAVLGSMLPLTLAYCCGGDGSGICGDGTTQGAGCCGYGPCNIFCCNCDPSGGTCRGGRGNKRMSELPAAFKRDVDAGTEATFNEIDKSGSGSFSLQEYLEWMNVSADNSQVHEHWVSWFKQHDTNDDGVITLEEAA